MLIHEETSMLHSTRHLPFPNLLNARDLGGCLTRDGLYTRWHALVRADDLHQLTRDGVHAMLAYGVRTVIDLRFPAEVDCCPHVFQQHAHGVDYVHMSLLGPSEDEWRARRPQTPKEFWNCVVLDCAQVAIGAILRVMAQAFSGGVLFHCRAGKDRTGVLAALLLALADVESAAIVDDYAMSVERLQEARLAAFPDIERAVVLESLRCPPEQVHHMLAHLDRHYGGAAGYLATIGLSMQEITCIRARLRADGASPRESGHPTTH
jgi:protein-tyrosine phosphatase